MKTKKRGQIWIETVIYTLIGLSLIGVILAFALPQVEKQKDRITIERTIEAMNVLENNIVSVKISGPSSTQQNIFTISRGQLTIDGENDKIIFEIEDSAYQYSEIDDRGRGFPVYIPGSSQKIMTTRNGKDYRFTSTLEYAGKINITYNLNDEVKVLGRAQTPYNLVVENRGNNQIDLFLS
jgi:type II secretory pathway pseudopilin PulG